MEYWEDRFLAKIDITAGCHLWTGQRDKNGYGKIKIDGRTVRAHCVAWTRAYGDILPGMCICHSCDNPPCVRIGHLWLGTSAENTADKMRKGRHGPSPGEANGAARLTAADVLAIRERRAAGQSYGEIALAFGVTYGHIWQIAKGRRWKHLL